MLFTIPHSLSMWAHWVLHSSVVKKKFKNISEKEKYMFEIKNASSDPLNGFHNPLKGHALWFEKTQNSVISEVSSAVESNGAAQCPQEFSKNNSWAVTDGCVLTHSGGSAWCRTWQQNDPQINKKMINHFQGERIVQLSQWFRELASQNHRTECCPS